jgi:hypothetical protein
MLTSLLIDLVILAAFVLLGLQLARAIAPAADRLLLTSVAFPLGSGIYTWCVFCLAWVGLPIGRGLLALVAAALLTGSIVFGRITKRRAGGSAMLSRVPVSAAMPDRILWGILGVLLLVALSLSVGRSYSAYDAAAGWAVKGYGMALEGELDAGRVWGLFRLGYPLNIMLQIATFSLFEGETLPGSKLLFPLYLAAICLGSYRFWRKYGVPSRPALLATAFLATNPVAFLQATNGYANLAFAAALVLGVLLSLEGILEGNGGLQGIGGLLLGIAAWTRPEGIGFSAVVVLGLILLRASARIGTIRGLHWLAPGAVIVLGWYAFAWKAVMVGHLGETIRAVPSGLSLGDANLLELYLIPRLFLERAISPGNWGLFLPAVLALSLLGLAARRSWQRPLMLSLVVLTLIAAALPVLIYYARAFAPSTDFQAVLRRDFDRAFLPGFFMLCITAVQAAAGRLQAAIPMVGEPRPQTAFPAGARDSRAAR